MNARYWVEKILKRCRREPNRMGDILVEGFGEAMDQAVSDAEGVLADKDQEIQTLKELVLRWKKEAESCLPSCHTCQENRSASLT